MVFNSETACVECDVISDERDGIKWAKLKI